ncbi:MAG: helix-turn-helix domain-containing protein, partial [Candidatus Promineifilaceae bacterium]|nr:helix-turn-helix domain-containing protein [Candidatus Promineifilaceae bacterium]
PDARLRNINLTVEEWRVVSFINPRNTIRQITRANNLSDFQVRRIVYGLLQAGLVEFVEQPKPPELKRRPQQIAQQEAAKQQSPTVKRSVVQRLIDRIRSL